MDLIRVSSGMSSSKIIFENYYKNNKKSSEEDDVPLSKRLSISDGHNESGHNSRNSNLRGSIKTIHTEKQGTMREISFIPKSDSKMSNRGRNNGGSSSIRRQGEEKAADWIVSAHTSFLNSSTLSYTLYMSHHFFSFILLNYNIEMKFL